MAEPTTPEGAESGDQPQPAGSGRRTDAASQAWSALPRSARWATYGVLGLVLALLAAAVVAVVVVRRPLPQVDGELEVAGLDGPVQVLRDENGIPQIWASTDADLLRAQGFVHAQERFYEMDVRRHATSGRLAELFGEAALASDRVVRTMGWRRVAEQEVALVEPRTRELFQAYADGVNAYLAGRGTSEIALAYTVLAADGLTYRPEPWTVADSLAWLKAMAWDLRGNMSDELDRALAAAAVGPERAEQLWPAYPQENAPIVSGGAVVDGVFEPEATTGGTRLPERSPPWAGSARAALAAARSSIDAVPSWLGRGDGLGSNSWVVGGENTTTGLPLLANDPHLGVGMPGVWMQVGLHCVETTPACGLDVSGFSFSGVPGVVIGHNADIAWGFTNLGPDVTDLYLERLRGDTARRGRGYEPLTTRTETIEVRGGDDVEITVRESRHGPLISDADDAGGGTGDLADVVGGAGGAGGVARSGEEVAVALQWTALTPGTTADALLALDQAGDWEEFRAAASSFEVPAQNLVYADREGRIGYQAPGRIPVRRSGNDGRLPAEGWRAEDDWSGDVVPFEGLPRVLDPPEGFVVTANQRVVDPASGYPYFLGDDFDRGYRSQRIRELIEGLLADGGKVSPAEMLEVQLDDRQPFASVLLPHLLRADLPRGYDDDGQRVLADWDLDQGADSAGAAYFNVVWRNLLARTFHDELPEDLWPDGGQRWFAVVGDLLETPDDPWWDDVATEDVVETRDDVVRAAMVDARDEIRRLVSRAPQDWSWGRLHRLELREQTVGDSGIGVVEGLFNRGGWEASGSSSAVDATSWDAAAGYDVTAAPSMRMLVDLSDLDASRWINLTGVSGHPFSAHYSDQTDLWQRGETLPWPSTREAVEDAAEHTLTLLPADD